MVQKMAENALLKALPAYAPGDFHRGKLMLFGQFVGDWDIVECRFLKEDGTWGITTGELHWGWILDGMALQDVWKGVAGRYHYPEDEGTTIRFYDPGLDAWHSIWISPSQNEVKSFIGRKVGDEIILQAESDGKAMENWIFYDISGDAFRWKAEISRDGGRNWETSEEMIVRRRRE